MFYHIELENRKLKLLIDNGEIVLGGNKQLKIYGTLSCKSGQRMKKENRVFFSSEKEAIDDGYRPCGHCMKTKYQKWKNRFGVASPNSYSTIISIFRAASTLLPR